MYRKLIIGILFLNLYTSCKQEITLSADKVSLIKYDFMPAYQKGDKIFDDTIYNCLHVFWKEEIDKNFKLKRFIAKKRPYTDVDTNCTDIYSYSDTILDDKRKVLLNQAISYYIKHALPPDTSAYVEKDCVCEPPIFYLLIERKDFEPTFISFYDVEDLNSIFYHLDDRTDFASIGIDSIMPEIKHETYFTIWNNYRSRISPSGLKILD